MKPFMDETYLLESDAARRLYFEQAAGEPVFDYHNHLSAREIYENRPAENIASLWFAADHYKWRLMRANGVDEAHITGDAPDYEKFLAFANTLPYAAGHPLYHWSHLELQRYFGVDTPLSGETAPRVWQEANAAIARGGFTPRELLQKARVDALCTTEDPADDLSYHAKLAADATCPIRVLPAFRPEKAGEIWRGETYRAYLTKLGEAADVEITSFTALKRALTDRMDAFSALGCRASDYGVERMPYLRADDAAVERIFARALAGETVSSADTERFLTEYLLWLAGEYTRRKWVMEMHVGPVRARNARLTAAVGRDAGFDSVADHPLADAMGAFLDALDSAGTLPRMVLFCLNHRDNLALMAAAGDFQNASFPSNIQVGTAWWVNDHRDGMLEQMRLLATQGLIGRFLGMTTDSRSFLSFSRHEYFRRVFCGLLGGWVEAGEYPNDPALLGLLVRGVCGGNAREFFGVK